MFILNEDLFDDLPDAVPEEPIVVDTQPEPTEQEQNNAVSTMLIDAINGEWETIDLYNNIIVNLDGTRDADIIAVIQDIVDEENIHVGQLQRALAMVSPQTDKIADGEQEAEEQLTDKEPVKEEFTLSEDWDEDWESEPSEKDLAVDEAITKLMMDYIHDNEDEAKIVLDYAKKIKDFDILSDYVGDTDGMTDLEIVETALSGDSKEVSDLWSEAIEDYISKNYTSLANILEYDIKDIKNSIYYESLKEARGRKPMGDTRDLWEKVYDELVGDVRSKYKYISRRADKRYDEQDLVINDNIIRVIMPSKNELDFAYEVAKYYNVPTRDGSNEKGVYVDLIIPEDQIKDM